jgi:hypothetical protein
VSDTIEAQDKALDASLKKSIQSNGSDEIIKISERLAQLSYGKSSSLDAKENQNSDFRHGYAVGMTAFSTSEESEENEWWQAWEDYGRPDAHNKAWQEFRRGFHAGKFAALAASPRSG